MSDREWTNGAKTWFWFVILVNLGYAVYTFWQSYIALQGINIPSYTPQVLWGLTLMFVIAPGLYVVYAGLHVWLMRSKKKAALYAIIAWFVLFTAIAFYLGEKNPLAGLVGTIITYNASRKVVD